MENYEEQHQNLMNDVEQPYNYDNQNPNEDGGEDESPEQGGQLDVMQQYNSQQLQEQDSEVESPRSNEEGEPEEAEGEEEEVEEDEGELDAQEEQPEDEEQVNGGQEDEEEAEEEQEEQKIEDYDSSVSPSKSKARSEKVEKSDRPDDDISVKDEVKQEATPQEQPQPEVPKKRGRGRPPGSHKEPPPPLLTPEQQYELSVKSAVSFNKRMHFDRIKLKPIMKDLDKRAFDENERIPIDSSNTALPSSFVPLLMYDKLGNQYFSNNMSTVAQKYTFKKFKKDNIDTEHQRIVPEQYNKLSRFAKTFERRRKRGRASKYDEDDDF